MPSYYLMKLPYIIEIIKDSSCIVLRWLDIQTSAKLKYQANGISNSRLVGGKLVVNKGDRILLSVLFINIKR